MSVRIKSILLVGLQFLLIGLLLAGSSFQKINLVAAILILTSILLVVWAIAAMRKSKLSILPVPSAHAVLITNGPYHFIRHPMYTAVLSGCAGLVIIDFTWIRLAMFVALAIVLIIKLNWEEKMLMNKFDAYKNYMKHTSGLIPFIF